MTNLRFTATNYAEEHTNRIHSDDVAREFGFAGALVPGVGIYSYIITPAVMEFGEWLDRGAASVKFLKPVYDGDEITVRSEKSDGSTIHLELHNSDGALCAVADAGLSSDLKPPSLADYPAATLPKQDDRRAALASAVPAGTVLGSLDGIFDTAKLGASFEVSVRAAALLLALANDIVAANISLGPWIHTSSEVTHFGRLEEGEPYSLRGSIMDSGQKRGHDYVVADLALFGAADRPIAAIRHSALIKLRSHASSSQ
jgi:hypothetical protein